ncbi:MAG: hypothetical protein ACYCOR_13565 [Acidobacteriaceae bacterium]
MNYYEKVWVQDSLNQVAIQRILDLIQNQGRSLPCKVISVTGALVTVAFQVNASPLTLPQITIPKAESNWIRTPTQVGDLGWTVPADAYLGGVSGLGGGVATLDQPGNLSALVFVPISNASSPPANQNAAIVQGPDGAVIQTTTGTASSAVVNQSGTALTFGSNSITLNNSEITLTAGGHTVTLNSTGFTIDGILFDTHVHGGVTTGGGITTGPQS